MRTCSNAYRNLLGGLLSAVVGLLSMSAANAQILLKIDDSNPAATIITAYGISNTTTDLADIANGVDLLGFFLTDATLNADFTTVGTSTLTTGDGSAGPIFTQGVGDNATVGGNHDLNLYHNHTSDQISFTSGQAGFTGTLVLDLSSISVPAAGASGNIILGYSGSQGAVVGQWQTVEAPEPSTWAMMLISSLGLLFWAGRKSRRA